ncbi:D-alanine--D-alanine ligase [Streptococcus azizii]|uniref:D-alanine--D-alanine ligase n=1 Tax=Streptococcus azizii TaxID=1579424 RepID=A0AB36JNN0_9STRE|nr:MULTISPECIES: D-alanine--D-alanine ligase [Streptococcus]MBF0776818.1 D-alanine--D-alanine ligase [Streptococcus sp. 19428wD3_AN2]ONK25692.1 D-alanine--D-alanine ligase [Streptococcus azizii]ONK25993.1 D-alanine--D-alanine ligase [Streptococcus azizii]ONK26139.1 D-alanine--D-alanine ligase [Streptococcus azizii]TFU82329.1 D-alanine--D-alanine ligase [Streptococcus sp. AN2]
MKQLLQYYLQEFDKECSKTNLFLVANLKKYTKKMSYYTIEHASDSEFFSLSEFEEIASALLKTGLCLNIFYTEMEFIEYILKNYMNLFKEDILVYNLARDGIREGKKSLIPSFCDYFNLDYTGSNALTVSLCRNKFIWGAVANRFNIATPKTVCISNGKVLGEIFEAPKYIRKEISQSASINLSEDSIISNFDWRKIDTQDFLLQEFIEGIEVEVPFFNFKGEYVVLNPVRVVSKTDILTSEVSDRNDYTFEYLQDKSLCKKLKEATEKLAQYLDISTYGRVDFRIKSDGNFFAFDVATMPYTTKHSSFHYNFYKYNLTMADLHKLILFSSL